MKPSRSKLLFAPFSSTSSADIPVSLSHKRSLWYKLKQFINNLNGRILWNQFIFLLTGLVSTLGAQILNYKKAADSKSLLTLLSTYLGMVCVVFLPTMSSKKKEYQNIPMQNIDDGEDDDGELKEEDASIDHKGVMGVAVLDVVGQAILTVGLFYVGSGLYQVIYSSIIVFTALYNKLFLKRSLLSMQWVSVFVITFGLSINAFSNGSSAVHKFVREILADDKRIGIGFIVTIFGVAVYSLVYTLNDYLMTSPDAKHTPPRKQCLWVGVYSTIVCLILMLIISIPTLSQMPLSDPEVAFGYFILILSAFGHNVTYFELVNCTGAVATGVLQALRAVLVFLLSHLLFCTTDSAQCFNAIKGLSTFVVVSGVLGFAYAQSRAFNEKIIVQWEPSLDNFEIEDDDELRTRRRTRTSASSKKDF